MTVNKRFDLDLRPVLPPICNVDMDDLLTIRGTCNKPDDKSLTIPGYMKSTLRAPGPCVRLVAHTISGFRLQQTDIRRRYSLSTPSDDLIVLRQNINLLVVSTRLLLTNGIRSIQIDITLARSQSTNQRHVTANNRNHCVVDPL
ncbi:hypothetical protein LSH36_11g04015 [Paralvinella palmiformis]|uniref:Uncharacterized protein n=1 Tax=Paralvinella palmiformis TaxID=53620 RepID=A0AAD9NJC5_9ANNE|nr:hypothetical protein LSH36_11g04015 [Paralvinella palmiformis]